MDPRWGFCGGPRKRHQGGSEPFWTTARHGRLAELRSWYRVKYIVHRTDFHIPQLARSVNGVGILDVN